jgi:NADPH:quinone reductase-like Zn-dependent oxidoreductase
VSVFRIPPAALTAATDAITALLAEHALSHPIAARFPLEHAAAAHDHLERSQAIGKTLLEIA